MKFSFKIIYVTLIQFFELLFCLSTFTSCEKEPNKSQIILQNDSTTNGVFIINEGNFQQANASLGFINYTNNIKYDDVFEPSNGRKLGDVLQSMTMYKNKIYLVVNNSGIIEIIHPQTFKSIASISGFRSPRYLLPIDSNKAYVSDLYDNAISVLDLNSKQIVKKIPLIGWSEEMISLNGNTYVTNMRKNFISVIDNSTDAIVDTITTPFAPKNILLDSANRIWILCGDNVSSIDNKYFIVRLDSLNENVEIKFEIKTTNVSANKLRINKDGNTLFWIDKDVFKMSIYSKVLPTQPIVYSNGKSFYGLNIDLKFKEIWVSDVKDFNSNSDVFQYDFSGNLRGSFTAGKITGDFYFSYK